MVFKKTYTVNVEIDLDACHWDDEWGVEDWEVDNAGELLSQIQEDLRDFVDAHKEA